MGKTKKKIEHPRVLHGKENHALFDPCDECDDVREVFRLSGWFKKHTHTKKLYFPDRKLKINP